MNKVRARVNKTWSPSECARLEKLLGMIARDAGGDVSARQWRVIAAHFPDRSLKAVSDRGRVILSLRRSAETVVRRKARQQPRLSEGPATITAAVFGDPPPGRSALDQMRVSCAN
ncbi:hypothetical protein AFEL58S_02066 [Afipia felis]